MRGGTSSGASLLLCTQSRRGFATLFGTSQRHLADNDAHCPLAPLCLANPLCTIRPRPPPSPLPFRIRITITISPPLPSFRVRSLLISQQAAKPANAAPTNSICSWAFSHSLGSIALSAVYPTGLLWLLIKARSACCTRRPRANAVPLCRAVLSPCFRQLRRHDTCRRANLPCRRGAARAACLRSAWILVRVCTRSGEGVRAKGGSTRD